MRRISANQTGKLSIQEWSDKGCLCLGPCQLDHFFGWKYCRVEPGECGTSKDCKNEECRDVCGHPPEPDTLKRLHEEMLALKEERRRIEEEKRRLREERKNESQKVGDEKRTTVQLQVLWSILLAILMLALIATGIFACSWYAKGRFIRRLKGILSRHETLCPVCFENWDCAHHAMQVLEPCHHVVCRTCLPNMQDTCPICRGHIGGYHEVT